MRSLFAALVAAAWVMGAASASAEPEVWDPVGSAEGVAATVQEAAENPGALAETTTEADCMEDGSMSRPTPPNDPFYTPPKHIPAGAPGTVIRIRPECVGLQGRPLPYRAWTIMYLTTGALDRKGEPSNFDAVPAVATGLIIAPINRGPRAKRPLVAWAPAQDSNSTLIAPSYQVAMGAWPPETALLQQLLAQGWAIVLPDYEGPDSAFAAGPLEGHAFLDGIRAAENLSSLAGLSGSETPVGMWGGSGGAIAVGWAAELQPRYAPELEVAVIELVDVPGDMGNTFNTINDGYLGPGVAFAAFLGVATAYPQLIPESMFNDAGTALAATFRATGTNQYPSAIPPHHIAMYLKCGCNPVKDPKRFPGVAKAIRTIDLGQHVPTAPLYITHSWNDELMPFKDTARLVKKYCDAGATVNFRVLMGDEHITHGYATWPEALATFAARFAGVAPINSCSLPDNGGVAPPVDPVPIPPPLPIRDAPE